MRLGIDASNLRAGGGLTYLCNLLRAADPEASGFERIVVWSGRHTLEALPTRTWLTCVGVPTLDSGLLARISWQRRELPALVRQSSDMLFVPGGSFHGGFSPVVATSHNMLPFQPEEMSRYGISWMLLRLLLLRYSHTKTLRRADGVIFLSEFARVRIGEHIGRTKGATTVIVHGVEERFRNQAHFQNSERTYSQQNPFRFLYVSIVDVYKHQWNVADAVAALRRAGWPAVIDFVGPAYQPALRRLQRTIRRLDPKGEFIYYRGPVDFDRLDDCYRRADGFVFASSCENSPLILLEAMASGLPIASSSRGPMPEFLGDGGIYFDPEQPEQIATSLRAIVSDSHLRARLAHTAYERARHHTWRRCADETLGFLSNIGSSHFMQSLTVPSIS